VSVLAALQGLMPNYVKVVPSIAIAFVSYEQVLFLLDLLFVLLLHCLLLLSSFFVACSPPGLSPASSFTRCSKQPILQAACCAVLPMPYIACTTPSNATVKL